MPIPKADEIRTFQAPTVDKLLARCEKQWMIVMAKTMEAIKQDQREVKVPLKGETREMVDEAISILEKQDYGYKYSVEYLDEIQDNWTTGYLVFSW
jgi:hypothetical protein